MNGRRRQTGMMGGVAMVAVVVAILSCGVSATRGVSLAGPTALRGPNVCGELRERCCPGWKLSRRRLCITPDRPHFRTNPPLPARPRSLPSVAPTRSEPHDIIRSRLGSQGSWRPRHARVRSPDTGSGKDAQNFGVNLYSRAWSANRRGGSQSFPSHSTPLSSIRERLRSARRDQAPAVSSVLSQRSSRMYVGARDQEQPQNPRTGWGSRLGDYSRARSLALHRRQHLAVRQNLTQARRTVHRSSLTLTGQRHTAHRPNSRSRYHQLQQRRVHTITPRRQKTGQQSRTVSLPQREGFDHLSSRQSLPSTPQKPRPQTGDGLNSGSRIPTPDRFTIRQRLQHLSALLSSRQQNARRHFPQRSQRRRQTLLQQQRHAMLQGFSKQNNATRPVVVSEKQRLSKQNNATMPVVVAEKQRLSKQNNATMPVVVSEKRRLSKQNNATMPVVVSEKQRLSKQNNATVPVVVAEKQRLSKQNNATMPVVVAEKQRLSKQNNATMPVVVAEKQGPEKRDSLSTDQSSGPDLIDIQRKTPSWTTQSNSKFIPTTPSLPTSIKNMPTTLSPPHVDSVTQHPVRNAGLKYAARAVKQRHSRHYAQPPHSVKGSRTRWYPQVRQRRPEHHRQFSYKQWVSKSHPMFSQQSRHQRTHPYVRRRYAAVRTINTPRTNSFLARSRLLSRIKTSKQPRKRKPHQVKFREEEKLKNGRPNLDPKRIVENPSFTVPARLSSITTSTPKKPATSVVTTRPPLKMVTVKFKTKPDAGKLRQAKTEDSVMLQDEGFQSDSPQADLRMTDQENKPAHPENADIEKPPSAKMHSGQQKRVSHKQKDMSPASKKLSTIFKSIRNQNLRSHLKDPRILALLRSLAARKRRTKPKSSHKNPYPRTTQQSIRKTTSPDLSAVRQASVQTANNTKEQKVTLHNLDVTQQSLSTESSSTKFHKETTLLIEDKLQHESSVTQVTDSPTPTPPHGSHDRYSISRYSYETPVTLASSVSTFLPPVSQHSVQRHLSLGTTLYTTLSLSTASTTGDNTRLTLMSDQDLMISDSSYSSERSTQNSSAVSEATIEPDELVTDPDHSNNMQFSSVGREHLKNNVQQNDSLPETAPPGREKPGILSEPTGAKNSTIPAAPLKDNAMMGDDNRLPITGIVVEDVNMPDNDDAKFTISKKKSSHGTQSSSDLPSEQEDNYPMDPHVQHNHNQPSEENEDIAEQSPEPRKDAVKKLFPKHQIIDLDIRFHRRPVILPPPPKRQSPPVQSARGEAEIEPFHHLPMDRVTVSRPLPQAPVDRVTAAEPFRGAPLDRVTAARPFNQESPNPDPTSNSLEENPQGNAMQVFNNSIPKNPNPEGRNQNNQDDQILTPSGLLVTSAASYDVTSSPCRGHQCGAKSGHVNDDKQPVVGEELLNSPQVLPLNSACPLGHRRVFRNQGIVCEPFLPSLADVKENQQCPPGQVRVKEGGHYHCRDSVLTPPSSALALQDLCPPGQNMLSSSNGPMCLPEVIPTTLPVTSSSGHSCPPGMIPVGSSNRVYCLPQMESFTTSSVPSPPTKEVTPDPENGYHNDDGGDDDDDNENIHCPGEMIPIKTQGGEVCGFPTGLHSSPECPAGHVLKLHAGRYRCRPHTLFLDSDMVCPAGQTLVKTSTGSVCHHNQPNMALNVLGYYDCTGGQILTQTPSGFFCLDHGTPNSDQLEFFSQVLPRCPSSSVAVKLTSGQLECVRRSEAILKCSVDMELKKTASGFFCQRKARDVKKACEQGEALLIHGENSFCQQLEQNGELCPDGYKPRMSLLGFRCKKQLTPLTCPSGFNLAKRNGNFSCTPIRPSTNICRNAVFTKIFGKRVLCNKGKSFGVLSPCEESYDVTNDEAEPVCQLKNDVKVRCQRRDAGGTISSCTITEGSPCPEDCQEGGLSRGKSCREMLEEARQGCQPQCANGGRCLEGRCICPAGVTGTTCQQDIDECKQLPPAYCQYGCQNLFGSFRCTCPENATLNADGRTCHAKECVPRCVHGGYCLNDRCVCPPGYTGPQCQQDVDECRTGRAQCQHLCVNTLGSFHCLCAPGTRLSADRATCINSTCTPQCVNGGQCYDHRCRCPVGFTGFVCQLDVNECSGGKHGCSNTCLNSYGSYRCTCPLGSTLKDDGKTCTQDSQSLR